MDASETSEETVPTRLTWLAELVFLSRVRGAISVLVLVLALLGTSAAGVYLDVLHRHLAASSAAGQELNPFASLLASGSSIATLWPGWVAAAFFAISIVQLQVGTPEPPTSRQNSDNSSVSELRAGLRREYLGVRIAFISIATVALIDTARTASVMATTQQYSTPSGTVAATVAEAAGLILATVLIGVWAWLFRSELERWGAI